MDGTVGGVTPENCSVKYKVLLLGESGVGKTCVMDALMGQRFKSHLPSTVGIDFVRKGFEVDGAKVLLEVWDTAGQERFRSITKFHYRGTKGVILMYDVTNGDSFDSLNYWMESIDRDLDQNSKEPAPVFIVGNKTDLTEKRVISTEEGQKVANANFVHGFVETSAKDNVNVDEVFSKLAYAMTEINEPALLNGYKHLLEKNPKIDSPPVETGAKPEAAVIRKKKKKKRRDYTRSHADSIVLSSSPADNDRSAHFKHKCACNKA